MKMPLIDRNSSKDEEHLLQLLLSFFSNGMGWENEANGTTRIGWRQIERVLSYFYSGAAHKEDKDVFDLVCGAWGNVSEKIGISVKSKELGGKSQIFSQNPVDTRLYLEISNSHAKFWDALRQNSIEEGDWGKKKNASKIGQIILDLVRHWHNERIAADPSINLERSRYLVVSYGSPSAGAGLRKCAVHSFDLKLPDADWHYASKKCLRGVDKQTGEHLWDWYGLSGGQLKFYPKAGDALFQTNQFDLLQAGSTPFIDLVEEQFGDLSPTVSNLSDLQRELFGR